MDMRKRCPVNQSLRLSSPPDILVGHSVHQSTLYPLKVCNGLALEKILKGLPLGDSSLTAEAQGRDSDLFCLKRRQAQGIQSPGPGRHHLC